MYAEPTSTQRYISQRWGISKWNEQFLQAPRSQRHIGQVTREMTFQFIQDETRPLNPKWFRVSKLTGEGRAAAERQPAARPPQASPLIYCEIATDSMCRAGEWVLLIREAVLLRGALFLSEWARMKSAPRWRRLALHPYLMLLFVGGEIGAGRNEETASGIKSCVGL